MVARVGQSLISPCIHSQSSRPSSIIFFGGVLKLQKQSVWNASIFLRNFIEHFDAAILLPCSRKSSLNKLLMQIIFIPFSMLLNLNVFHKSMILILYYHWGLQDKGSWQHPDLKLLEQWSKMSQILLDNICYLGCLPIAILNNPSHIRKLGLPDYSSYSK